MKRNSFRRIYFQKTTAVNPTTFMIHGMVKPLVIPPHMQNISDGCHTPHRFFNGASFPSPKCTFHSPLRIHPRNQRVPRTIIWELVKRRTRSLVGLKRSHMRGRKYGTALFAVNLFSTSPRSLPTFLGGIGHYGCLIFGTKMIHRRAVLYKALILSLPELRPNKITGIWTSLTASNVYA